MKRGAYLGEFELIVLLAVVRLGPDAYGMRIWKEIEDQTGRSAVLGAVYAALERLEKKGCVTSWMGDSTPERGGRAKRHFKVSRKGMVAIERSRMILTKMWSGLDPLLGKL
jgi:DNA-binding PadR family transcriptional regulator